MPIIGTAGHVDHGKSTLVERLTGRDPDRWVEEKQRGLTIDLGFAWTTFPGGSEVSFVDVPGHERFMKNMLAGVDAFDVVLFVVAADEGWSVQSEEHLLTLEALGCSSGVIAVTKIDLVEPDLAELAELEIADRFSKSTLAGAPVIGVSAHTGEGITELTAALESSVSQIVHRKGRPYLWIDRSFSVAGAGTVVTGSLQGGHLTVGDELTAFPHKHKVRIKTLQSHEREAITVGPGTRVAVSLSGSLHDLGRGSMLGRSDQWILSSRFLATVPTAVADGTGALHFHLGTGSWVVTVASTSATTAVLTLPVHVSITAGDKFILRDVGAQTIIGGGTVLNPLPAPRLSSIRPTVVALAKAVAVGPDATATELLRVLGTCETNVLFAASGGGAAEAIRVGDHVLDPGYLSELTDHLYQAVTQSHEDNPLHDGLPKAEAAARLRTTPQILSFLIESNDHLVELAGAVARSDFEPTLSDASEDAWLGISKQMKKAGLVALSRADLDLSTEEIHLRARRGQLIQVAGFLFDRDVLDQLVVGLQKLAQPFTVAEFRDHFQLTRKYAVPLVEWLDNELITRRAGDQRTLRGSS